MLKPARLADYTIVFATGRMVLAYLATDPKASRAPRVRVVQSAVVGSAGEPRLVRRADRVRCAHQRRASVHGSRRVPHAHDLRAGAVALQSAGSLQRAAAALPGERRRSVGHSPAPALGKDFNFQFTYEHNAAAAAKRDPSYRYAMLPMEIDLSSTREDLYPSGVTIPGLGIPGSSASVTIPASPVAWGVTIPGNAPNRDNAVAFVEQPSRPNGRAALTANGPTPMPSRARLSFRLPASSGSAPGVDDRQLILRCDGSSMVGAIR